VGLRVAVWLGFGVFCGWCGCGRRGWAGWMGAGCPWCRLFGGMRARITAWRRGLTW